MSDRDEAFTAELRELGYELVELLGSGGMGQVWRARERSLARDVALKFIGDASEDPQAKRRFVVEARALARISHPNVVAVYTLGEVAGQPFLAYELVEGTSIDQLIDSLDWARALAIGLDLARGLAAAHEAEVLHRDLKPSNAMVTREGVGKLIDFGLAKLLRDDGELEAPPLTGHGALLEFQTFDVAGPTLDGSAPAPPSSFSTKVGIGRRGRGRGRGHHGVRGRDPRSARRRRSVRGGLGPARAEPRRPARDPALHRPGAVAGAKRERANRRLHPRAPAVGDAEQASGLRGPRSVRARRGDPESTPRQRELDPARGPGFAVAGDRAGRGQARERAAALGGGAGRRARACPR